MPSDNEQPESEMTVDERSIDLDATLFERHMSTTVPPTELTVAERPLPEPTVDERHSMRVRTGRLRTILPPELLEKYHPLENLNVSSGQADLVLAKDKVTDTTVVIKLYRNAAQLDFEVLTRLHQADPTHVVRLLDHGTSDGEPWEVQEFCELGTLSDYRRLYGGTLSEENLRAIVQELAEAIHHIHELGITHRDLKPDNVLVRSIGTVPDVVLTDFGVASEQLVTVQLQTIAASWAWAAPEVHTKGQVAYSIDWWALGAITFQLLVGRHLVANPDGRLPDEKQIRALIVDGLYTTDAVASPRWRNLIDGLLSYNPTNRWGYSEVMSWLNGGDPQAIRTVPLASLRTVETRELRFVFNGRPVRTGVELVQAMRRDWPATHNLLTGRIDPTLESWLRTRPHGDHVMQSLLLEKTSGARLVRLQAELDPTSPLEFLSRRLDDDELDKAIRLACQWEPNAEETILDAHRWLAALRHEHILTALAAILDEPDAARLGRAGALLDAWGQQAKTVLEAIPFPELRAQAAQREQEMMGFLFAAALGKADIDEVVEQAHKTLRDRDTEGAAWAEDLARRAHGPALNILGWLVTTTPVIAQVTRSTAEAREKHRAEIEARENHIRQQQEMLAQAEEERLRHITRQQRIATLRSQIISRLVACVFYSGFCGIIGVGFTVLFTADAFFDVFWPVFRVCVVTAGIATVGDWFMRNPAGPLRATGATTGLILGVTPWLPMLFLGQVSTSRMVILPLLLGICWTTGAALSFASHRAQTTYPSTEVSTKILSVHRWTRWPIALGAITGISAALLNQCTAGCTTILVYLSELTDAVAFLHFDPFGLGTSFPALALVVLLSIVLHIVAPNLARISKAAGVTAAVVAPILGLLAFFSYRMNLFNIVLSFFL